MKPLFIAAGGYDWASSRMRCYWPAAHIDGARVYTPGKPDTGEKYDVVVWQKVANIEAMERQRAEGIRVIYDACDPMWWFSPKEMTEIIQHVDAVTTSTAALTRDFIEWSGNMDIPAYTVHDMVDLAHFPIKAKHKDTLKPRLVWFGVAQNRIALFSTLANLSRAWANGYRYDLTILDDQPYVKWFDEPFEVHYEEWSIDTENAVIASHDIALLPPYPGPWGLVKSKNKHVTAWACGLPVTTGLDYAELTHLLDSAENRIASLPTSLYNDYMVENVVNEWRKVMTCA